MNKKIIIILILLMLFSSISFSQEVYVSAQLNGDYLKTSKPNILIKDKTYIIAKDFVNAIGEEIIWDSTKRDVIINFNKDKLVFNVDKKNVFLNGKKLSSDIKPIIREDRTYIPLRYISEFFDFDVKWEQDSYNVVLEKDNLKINKKFIDNKHYTKEDIKWLSKIVDVESVDTSMPMKLGIANVVLNRVKSSRFPNSIKDVIFQVDVHVQFPPAHKEGFKNTKPSFKSIIAAKNALEGKNNIDNCLFFNNAPFTSKKDDLFKIIDGEYFYK
ncbi:MAG: stalk domain-containing protein [Bacillota bacterium]